MIDTMRLPALTDLNDLNSLEKVGNVFLVIGIVFAAIALIFFGIYLIANKKSDLMEDLID